MSYLCIMCVHSLCYRLDLIHVMTSIGNTLANSVWEASTKMLTKPAPTGPRYVTSFTVDIEIPDSRSEFKKVLHVSSTLFNST